MATVHQLEKRIESIEQRNSRVEIDKSWETSILRKMLLMIFTYVAISLYMYAIHVTDPWLNAVIPTIGFFLSTLTLPFFKTFWIRHLYHS